MTSLFIQEGKILAEVRPEEDEYILWRSARKNARRLLEFNIPHLAVTPF